MKNEEEKLKQEFKQLMEESYPNMPSFEEVHKPKQQNRTTVLFPLLKVAAAILMAVGLFYFLRKEPLATSIPIAQWEAPSAQLIPPIQPATSLSNWKSPTDFLMPKIEKNEK